MSGAETLTPERVDQRSFTRCMVLDALVGGVEQGPIINLPQVGISGRGVDAFSDCIALTMGLGETDGGAATIWLRSPTLGSCEVLLSEPGQH